MRTDGMPRGLESYTPGVDSNEFKVHSHASGREARRFSIRRAFKGSVEGRSEKTQNDWAIDREAGTPKWFTVKTCHVPGLHEV
jgi:hypothetical protein